MGGLVVDTDITVRYEETDRMGAAYYANYLVWFEVGRTALFARLGLPYRILEEEHSCILPVVEAFCRYRRSVGYDDRVVVRTALSEVRRRGLTFSYLLERDGEPVAEGYTKHVVVDERGKVRSFPDGIYEVLKRAEHGDIKTRRRC